MLCHVHMGYINGWNKPEIRFVGPAHPSRERIPLNKAIFPQYFPINPRYKSPIVHSINPRFPWILNLRCSASRPCWLMISVRISWGLVSTIKVSTPSDEPLVNSSTLILSPFCLNLIFQAQNLQGRTVNLLGKSPMKPWNYPRLKSDIPRFRVKSWGGFDGSHGLGCSGKKTGVSDVI